MLLYQTAIRFAVCKFHFVFFMLSYNLFSLSESASTDLN